ncbi:phosphatase PAP2 family protein [Streptomyces sp. NPDC005438]|uniref:bifunctional phosphatase PAP2/diacylglycerol kinase family protein n=1 Tax=Streptomyces sp. NPDC005438 TaxID=3156880 RepID=UPI0033B7BD83
MFDMVAHHHWPGAERVLPRLSRSADHGRLWLVVAAAMAAAGGPPARRGAARGLASLAVASATVNTLGKRSTRRARPLLDGVPARRHLHRQPLTTSFPSGHSASAAAFVTGVALESRFWGAVLAPVAASVAFSRVYTGVHYPGDVLAGAAIGAGAAFTVRGLAPTRDLLPPPARPVVDAPALPEGEGLVLVANTDSGHRQRTSTGEPAPLDGQLEALRQLLPKAEVVVCDPRSGELPKELEEAATRAAAQRGALGIYGGDGTVNSAATVAMRHGLPLAVFPGGTYNHFAQDLGLLSALDTGRAVASGHAVAVDLGRFLPGPDGQPGHFVNTFSLGSYPELVRLREHWAPRIGAWPAGVLAAVQVLRTAGPVEAGLGGQRRPLWMLFAGNGAYRGVGLAPVRRHDLADGLLDVRYVRGGRWSRTRLVAAALTAAFDHSPFHGAARLRSLRINDVPEGTYLAFDGEVAPAPRELLLEKSHEALRVYRPLHG